jgi:hypothetical protein
MSYTLECALETPLVVSAILAQEPTEFLAKAEGEEVSSFSAQATRSSSSDIWDITFTFTATGRYFLFVANSAEGMDPSLLCVAEVKNKTTDEYLQNLEDEALGSWSWNKTTGCLSLTRQDGTSFATFSVVDTLTDSSRERKS